MALCIAESEDGAVPLIPTAAWGYLRLHKPAYEAGELDKWASEIANQPWEEAWVYFKHDTDTAGPELAQAFAQRFR